MLNELYLSLWKQLDLLSDEDKWLEIRPIEPAEAAQIALSKLNGLEQDLPEGELLERARADYRRTQDLLSQYSAQKSNTPPEVAAFKTYLAEQEAYYDDVADQADGLAG